MRAVLHGNKTAVAMLIEAGSEVNHQDANVQAVVFYFRQAFAAINFFFVFCRHKCRH
jgi:hypothetical protein